MNEPVYTHYAWSIRLNGWWGLGSVYTSDIKQAKPYTEVEIIKFCKIHTSPGGGLAAIPVRIADLDAVMAK